MPEADDEVPGVLAEYQADLRRLRRDSAEWEARYRHLRAAAERYVTEPSNAAMDALLAALEV